MLKTFVEEAAALASRPGWAHAGLGKSRTASSNCAFRVDSRSPRPHH